MSDYENEMRWVMRYVLDGGDIGKLDNDEKRLLKECVDAKYLDGVELAVMASGRIIMEIRHEAKITRAGAEFLASEEKALEEEVRQNTDDTVDKRKENVVKRFLFEVAVAVAGGVIIFWITSRFF